MEDMAESIEDVRAGPLPISTRCGGAVAAIGGFVLVGEPAGGLETARGSETLREVSNAVERLGLILLK